MAQSFDSLTAAQIAAGVAVGDFTATEVAQALSLIHICRAPNI